MRVYNVEKKMKLTDRLTIYLNSCMSLLQHIQQSQNTLMLTEDNNITDHFMYYKEEKQLLSNKKQDIEEDQK